jgi:hypothetical protein
MAQRRTKGRVLVDVSWQRFGKLIALYPVSIGGSGTRWLCRCDCGNTSVVLIGNLNAGAVKSCGCSKINQAFHHRNPPTRLTPHVNGKRLGPVPIDITGARFGKLVAVRFTPGIRGSRGAWLCQCDCGKTRTATAGPLRNGCIFACGKDCHSLLKPIIDLPGEEWRPIGSCPGYDASSEGRVRLRGVKVLPLYVPTSGYFQVGVVIAGRQRAKILSRLVCEAFSGYLPSNPMIDAAHENGIKTDNRSCNLTWKTRKANSADKARHGTLLFGSKSPVAILDESSVSVIKERIRSGHATKQIAREYGVSWQAIFDIKRGRTWNRVA